MTAGCGTPAPSVLHLCRMNNAPAENTLPGWYEAARNASLVLAVAALATPLLVLIVLPGPRPFWLVGLLFLGIAALGIRDGIAVWYLVPALRQWLSAGALIGTLSALVGSSLVLLASPFAALPITTLGIVALLLISVVGMQVRAYQRHTQFTLIGTIVLNAVIAFAGGYEVTRGVQNVLSDPVTAGTTALMLSLLCGVGTGMWRYTV